MSYVIMRDEWVSKCWLSFEGTYDMSKFTWTDSVEDAYEFENLKDARSVMAGLKYFEGDVMYVAKRTCETKKIYKDVEVKK